MKKRLFCKKTICGEVVAGGIKTFLDLCLELYDGDKPILMTVIDTENRKHAAGR